jgi:hypothetical protein
MEYLIKDLIVRLSARKVRELNLVEQYKNENLNELLMFSAGKVAELEQMINELEELIRYHSNFKS